MQISETSTQITDSFQLAFNFVQYTDRTIFLTGKAGTGKTTFLRYVKEHALKEMAVVAPTGVAAINAGGVTIHSFFQLPLEHFIPEERPGLENMGIIHKKRLLAGQHMTGNRRKVLQALELLVIDEVSMVRADLLDMIDVVLRHVRFKPNEPFGGVQLLLIGDLYQLPPVVDDQSWSVLNEFYPTPFFFSARVMQQAQPVHISFEKVFRQQDETFIKLLNAVRNNALNQELAEVLHQRYIADFQPDEEAGYITLTTHNNKANAINENMLARLETEPLYFKATITGDFSNKAYPADEILTLKVGAQVMFLKNDLGAQRRYFNGKIGKVLEIAHDAIKVKCPDDEFPITVTRYKWENIRYVPNLLNGQVEPEEVGAFWQFPLRLAWAITIHKSQGLTFDRAVIDAEDAFAAGQAYVALSRCRTMEGMVLKSPVRAERLATNRSVEQYTHTRPDGSALPSQLEQALQDYSIKRLKSIFSLGAAAYLLGRVSKVYGDNPPMQNEVNSQWLNALQEKVKALQEVIKKFHAYIDTEKDKLKLDAKTASAATYFSEKLNEIIAELKACPFETDNKTVATELKADLKELFDLLAFQLKSIELTRQGFDLERFMHQRKQVILDKWEPIVSADAKAPVQSRVPNAALYQQLISWRNNEAEVKDLPIFRVLPTSTLKDLAKVLPQNAQQMMMIPGIGSTKVKQYGDVLLEMILSYCAENNLVSNLDALASPRKPKPESKPKADKPDTKRTSFELFKAGKTIEEIAKERGFVTSTIEGHLAHFVESGELHEKQFVPENLIEPIRKLMLQEKTWNEIVAELGQVVSFTHLKFMSAAKKRDAAETAEK